MPATAILVLDPEKCVDMECVVRDIALHLWSKMACGTMYMYNAKSKQKYCLNDDYKILVKSFLYDKGIGPIGYSRNRVRTHMKYYLKPQICLKNLVVGSH